MTRIAWFGPAPSTQGGVPYASGQVLRALDTAGAQVDAYIATGPDPLADLSGLAGVRVFTERMAWEWDRWYSRRGLLTVPSAQIARALAQRRLVQRLLDEHARAPYDAIHQFSQFETPWSRRHDARLPPIVIHPEVHAAGELGWYRRERDLARRCEPASKRAVTLANLRVRTAMQRRYAARAAGVIAPSAAFGRHLTADYDIDPAAIRVVANPIDLDRFSPRPQQRGTRLDVLFVSRISVRKGVELIVELSHRVTDLADRVRIRVIGEHALFSDYRPLLSDLNGDVAVYEGALPGEALAATYSAADGLLQPSKYEPFALTVGEGLASGCLVAASDEVGAAEQVDESVCIRFPADDIDGLETAFRALVDRLEGDPGGALRQRARAESERLFAPAVVGRGLREALVELAARAGR